MSRVTASLAVLALLIAGAAMAPPVGSAATSTVSPQAAIPAEATVEVQWWMEAEDGQVIAIISTSIDPEAELPAVVRLPIPPGMTVDWAGEISGGDVSQDIQRQFTVKDGAKAAYAEFEVSQYRVAQIDLSGKALSQDGEAVVARLEYVQSVPSSDTAFSVRLPPGASSVKIEPAPEGAPNENSVGETLYTLPSLALEPGDSQTTVVEYSTTGAAPSPAEGGGAGLQANQLVALLAAIAAGIGVALVVMVRRQHHAALLASEAHQDEQQHPGASTPAADPSTAEVDDSDEPFDYAD